MLMAIEAPLGNARSHKGSRRAMPTRQHAARQVDEMVSRIFPPPSSLWGEGGFAEAKTGEGSVSEDKDPYIRLHSAPEPSPTRGEGKDRNAYGFPTILRQCSHAAGIRFSLASGCER